MSFPEHPSQFNLNHPDGSATCAAQPHRKQKLIRCHLPTTEAIRFASKKKLGGVKTMNQCNTCSATLIKQVTGVGPRIITRPRNHRKHSCRTPTGQWPQQKVITALRTTMKNNRSKILSKNTENVLCPFLKKLTPAKAHGITLSFNHALADQSCHNPIYRWHLLCRNQFHAQM